MKNADGLRAMDKKYPVRNKKSEDNIMMHCPNCEKIMPVLIKEIYTLNPLYRWVQADDDTNILIEIIFRCEHCWTEILYKYVNNIGK